MYLPSCPTALLPSQLNTEESLEPERHGTMQVVTTLTWVEVEGIPSCVTWATCQVCCSSLI